MTATDELLPCPFCGAKAKVMVLDLDPIYEGRQIWGVWCEDDLNEEYEHGHFIDNYASKEEAIAAWNRRVGQ